LATRLHDVPSNTETNLIRVTDIEEVVPGSKSRRAAKPLEGRAVIPDEAVAGSEVCRATLVTTERAPPPPCPECGLSLDDVH
jgi:hypothetical protein